MRIVQITDLHVGQEGEDTYGVDVRSNFLKIKEEIARIKPDHLVGSGDLCYRSPERSVYEWIKGHLDGLSIPYDLLSGNHDDPVMMADVFNRKDLLKENEFYFARQLNGQKVLFLDSTTGYIAAGQMEWLQEQLKEMERYPVIFVHHPLLKAGVPYMDNRHALKNLEEVQEILFGHPGFITLFTGHYHVEKTIRQNNMLVHITPSCFFQIDQHSPEFKVDHRRIALREIVFENCKLLHTVKYL